jgi:PIN domain nuclease of toxin-antitoxin system
MALAEYWRLDGLQQFRKGNHPSASAPRIQAEVWIDQATTMPGVRLVPLLTRITVESSFLPWNVHADPADRIIIATARYLGAKRNTADEQILHSGSQRLLSCMSAK